MIGKDKRASISHHIVLTGFMGVGKSTVGRLLASLLNLKFSDLDQVIEAQVGSKVCEIFQTSGEAFFREKESEVLGQLLREDAQVIALGGGAFLNPGNLKEIKPRGLTIYLKASIPTLCSRLNRQDPEQRPLLLSHEGLDQKTQVQNLLRQRESLYGLADFWVDTDEKQPEQVAHDILKLISFVPQTQEESSGGEGGHCA